jgi:hypothetical protein
MNVVRIRRPPPNATRRVIAEARWRMVLACSLEGASKKQTAEEMGLTMDGLNSLLHRNVGSQAWPIAQERLRA